MAIPKEYINKNVNGLRGLRANKDFSKFYYRFKINTKEHTCTIDYSSKTWTPKVRKDTARKEAEAFKEKRFIEFENPFNSDTKLDFIADEYFNKKCSNTDWTKARIRLYELYIKPFIGSKKVNLVIENDIDKIRKFMENKGYSNQNKNGCSIRTIEKVLLQTLKPILEYSYSNGALTKKIPQINIPKHKKKNKKLVTDASEKLILLFKVICERYHDDPFYRALFLFALYGRRWNEIATIEWTDIDINKNKYTIQTINNKIREEQTYDLPEVIKQPLLQLEDKQGLVFKSPVTNKKLSSPRRQLNKIKIDANIPELTMHYFRHILVTALGETGTAATVLSASLGHTRAETVDEVYRTINHLKSSQNANKQLENIIDIQVEE